MPARKIENCHDEFKDFIDSTLFFLVQINNEPKNHCYEFDFLENGVIKYKHLFKVVKNNDISYMGTIKY